MLQHSPDKEHHASLQPLMQTNANLRRRLSTRDELGPSQTRHRLPSRAGTSSLETVIRKLNVVALGLAGKVIGNQRQRQEPRDQIVKCKLYSSSYFIDDAGGKVYVDIDSTVTRKKCGNTEAQRTQSC